VAVRCDIELAKNVRTVLFCYDLTGTKTFSERGETLNWAQSGCVSITFCRAARASKLLIIGGESRGRPKLMRRLNVRQKISVRPARMAYCKGSAWNLMHRPLVALPKPFNLVTKRNRIVYGDASGLSRREFGWNERRL
jgi:hypothetical protein